MEEHGVIFRVPDSDRAERLREKADYAGSFTDVVDSYEWNGKGEEMVLLSLGRDEIEWLGLIKRAGRVATQRDRLSFTHLRRLPSQFPSGPSHTRCRRSSKDTFNRTCATTVDASLPVPGGRSSTRSGALARRVKNSSFGYEPCWPLQAVGCTGSPGEVVAQEKDAINLALRASGMSASHVGGWTPGIGPAPFLSVYPRPPQGGPTNRA